MKKNININNIFLDSYTKRKKIKKNTLFVARELNKIFVNIDKKKDTLHSLSKKFKFDFGEKYLKKYKKFSTVIIIGMGGSILGAKAIHHFMQHKIKKDFLFIDNLDRSKIVNLNKKRLKNALFIIVSKSGNTIETLANINLLKKIKLNLSNTILISEDGNNAIMELSKKVKIPVIKHKKYISGRYSVLSEPGMVPSHLMGLKIKNFRKNLLDYFKGKKKKLLAENVSKISEIYLSKKINSIVLFNYSFQLSEFMYWCQQLIAESLGKKGKGLLPIVSSGPKDHHSLLQLYLDGPKDKFFYIISSNNFNDAKVTGNYLSKKFTFLKNKKLNKIILSQKDALVKTLKKKDIPFREIQINNFSEESAGELFSYFMLETAMLGKLMNINPFNQPAVEEVKIFTKRLLI